MSLYIDMDFTQLMTKLDNKGFLPILDKQILQTGEERKTYSYPRYLISLFRQIPIKAAKTDDSNDAN